jgi:hypothetical protein
VLVVHLALKAHALQAEGLAAYLMDLSLPVVVALTTQQLALGAGVDVFFGVVSEGVPAEQGSAFFVVDQRGVGADARLLYGCYVLGGAVGGVCCDRVRA